MRGKFGPSLSLSRSGGGCRRVLRQPYAPTPPLCSPSPFTYLNDLWSPSLGSKEEQGGPAEGHSSKGRRRSTEVKMSDKLPKRTWWGTFGDGGRGKPYWSGLLQVQGTEPQTKSAQTKGRSAGSPNWEVQRVPASGAAGCRGCAVVCHLGSDCIWFSSARSCSSEAGKVATGSCKLAASQVSGDGEKGSSLLQHSHINFREVRLVLFT